MDEIFRNILSIEEIKKIEFKKIIAGEWTFYLVFNNKNIFIHGNLTSSEINPLGIIYKINEDFYFAPISKNYNINEIIENFVKII